MTELPLDIVLQIRNEMQQGMSQALQELRAFRAESNALNTAGGKLVDIMTTFTQIGVVTRGLRTGLEVVTAGIRAFKGDTEGVWTVLQRLPFGMGEVVREVHDLVGELSGAKEQAEAIQRAIDAAGRVRDLGKTLEDEASFSPFKDIDAVEKKRRERISQLEIDLANQRAMPRPDRIDFFEKIGDTTSAKAKEAAQINLARQRQYDREMADAEQHAQELREQINKQADEEIAAIEENSRRKTNALLEAGRETAVKEAEELRKRQGELYRERMEFAERLEDLQEETAQRELVGAGKAAEAERLQIKNRFAKLRAIAEEDQKALIDDLERRQLASVKDETEKFKEEKFKEEKSNTAAVLLSNEFHGLAAQRKEAESTRQKLTDIKKAVDDGNEKIVLTMEKVARALPKAVMV